MINLLIFFLGSLKEEKKLKTKTKSWTLKKKSKKKIPKPLNQLTPVSLTSVLNDDDYSLSPSLLSSPDVQSSNENIIITISNDDNNYPNNQNNNNVNAYQASEDSTVMDLRARLMAIKEKDVQTRARGSSFSSLQPPQL